VRVHRLRVTAFGPFAGACQVDLDALAAGGLFLLHGPTGAGKTSVLDAVCFALYGNVPGGRQGGRLRSDHAAAGVAPEVVCEFSAAGRRLEVTRSPAWERPKRRGTGTTLEQARVLLRELRDGEWVPLTNRVDEAAGVLEDVLGLGLDQFTKLVLLPQGDFAAFLRSDAETRRRLLERLFGTDRFADVQQWLRESQNLLRQEVDQARERVAHLLARAQQAAGTAGVPVPLPSDDDGVDPLEQLGGLRAGVAAALEEARARRVAAQERARHVDDEHRAAVQLATLQERRQELLGRRERLDAARAAHEGRRARLVAAVRVAGLARWLEPLAAARSRSAAALIAMDAALVEFAEADPGFASSSDTSHAIGGPAEGGQAQLELPFEGAESPDDARLQGRRQAALELVGELAAVERRAADAARVSRELAAARRTATRLQAERTAADVELARCEDELRQTAAALADALAAAAALGSASARLERAREVARAAAEVRAQEGRCAELSERAAGLRRRRDDLRERWLDLRQRRLEGMAAELARTLALGAPCPVCGSAEHPSPAPGAAGGVDEAAEREAEHAVAAAQDELAGCERELTEARALAAAASAAAGGTGLEQALATCAGLEREVADAEVAGTRAATLEASLARQETARDAARSRCEAAATAGAGADGEVTRLEERHGALVKLLSAAADGYASVAARKAAAVRAAAAAEQLLTARAELRAATEQLAEVTRAARAAAGDAGFAVLESACEAALGPAEVDLLEEQCRAHEQEDAVVTAALADPALLAAATAPPARPAVIALAADLARADDEAAAAALDRCLTAATGLAELETALTEHLTAVAPLLERYRLESELARCLDGTGGDNTLRMSLSSYVLAARLEQVAAAASERLQAMSGGRYSLVHCDEAERGRGRSGLSLRVVDGWTGRQRDTASLSGGESFYTSLALALGLADVVTAEAGGASVETLFVDEGFGSLDEDTLGEVMDVLDALRSGGRVVGLVSHVADMRDRIPARLEVVKTPTGSTLRQASA
jgi:exonuclease SbcC